MSVDRLSLFARGEERVNQVKARVGIENTITKKVNIGSARSWVLDAVVSYYYYCW